MPLKPDTLPSMEQHEGLAEAINGATQYQQAVWLACKQLDLIVAAMRQQAISPRIAAKEIEEIVLKLQQRTGGEYELPAVLQVKGNG